MGISNMLTPYEVASLTVKALDDKKAQDIKLLRTTDGTVVAVGWNLYGQLDVQDCRDIATSN